MQRFELDYDHMFDICDKFFEDTGISQLLMKLFNEDTSGNNYNDYLNDFTSYVLHEFSKFFVLYHEYYTEAETDNSCIYNGPSTKFLMAKHAQFAMKRTILG